MKFYQLYDKADRSTYYLGVDKEKKQFTTKRKNGKWLVKGYATVDTTGYLAALSPITTNPLEYTMIEWIDKRP